MMGFCRRDQSGLTLVEILVAVAILMIGLVAVMQWFPMGTAGVETGRRQSTGVFLAEQKIEQIKAWALSTCTGPASVPTCPVAQGFTTVLKPGGTCANAGNPCADDGYLVGIPIPGYPEYSRTVTITDDLTSGNPPGTAPWTRKVVRVQVQYRRIGAAPGGQQVDFTTLIAQH